MSLGGRWVAIVVLATAAHGQQLLRVDDLDADGLDDLVMSTSVPGHELFALSAGSGSVLWTYDAKPLQLGSLGPAAPARLARASDLDRDGRADLAVAWICAESNARCSGHTVAVHSALDGRILVSRTCRIRLGSAGCELVSPGDTDGDGVRDLLLARWNADGTGAGIEELCGRTLRTLANHPVGEPASSVSAALRGSIDGDGDGCVEFSASAASAGWASIAYEADDRAALLVRDPRTGALERRGTIDGYDVWQFEDWRLEPFVDFDGDGREDFLLATPGRGRWSHSWCDDRGVGGVRILSAHGLVLREFLGDTALARLGTEVAAAGDVDRDGLEDVWAVQVRQIATPELLLLSGGTDACIRRRLVTTW